MNVSPTHVKITEPVLMKLMTTIAPVKMGLLERAAR